MKYHNTKSCNTFKLRHIGIAPLLTLLLIGCSNTESDATNTTTPSADDIPQQQPDDQPIGNQPTEQPPIGEQQSRAVLQGSDLNNIGSFLLSLNPDGPGGSPNQSLRSGDVLQAGSDSSVLIGGLGIDVLVGGESNDVLIGGTEDFNSSVDGDGLGADNRDKAFGAGGDDMFIWAPGDGSDFFDGGDGIDVLTLGVLGEERDNTSNTLEAPFFNVSPPGTDGSFNFDGIFLNPETYLPIVNVSESPGFCTILDTSTNPEEMAALSLDNLVRFTLRGVANAFDAGERTDDDGLRVALSIRNVEYVVCAKREVGDGAGVDNIEVLDISSYPPVVASLSDLPLYIQQQIQ